MKAPCNLSHCECLSCSRIKMEENRAVLYIDNKGGKDFLKCKIDGGCCNSQTQKKCDYVVHCPDGRLFLIELKGKKVNIALEQIINTAKMLFDRKITCHNHAEGSKISGYVVTSNTPKSTTDWQKAMKESQKKTQKTGLRCAQASA